MKERCPELAGGCGNNIQSLWSTVQGGGFRADLEAELSPSTQEAKEIGGAGGWAHEHGHLVPVGDLDLEWKGTCSDAEPGVLGMQQQRFGGRPVGLGWVAEVQDKPFIVGWPGAEKSRYERNGAQGNFRHQMEVKKLRNGDLGSMEPEGSIFGRHRQYSLYRASASKVLHQFAWEGFSWCCGRPRQIGGDFLAIQIPKLCFLSWLSDPLALRSPSTAPPHHSHDPGAPSPTPSLKPLASFPY